jgi:ferric-dicitrate binding protein FerR (iron transport regulator)
MDYGDMAIPQARPDRLLERYCAGDCTPSERADVEAWAAADPANAEMLKDLAVAWRAVGTASVPADQPDVQAAWLLVRNRIENEAPVVQALEPRRWTFWQRFALPGAVAAALTITVGGMWAAYAARHAAEAPSDDVNPMRVVSTHRGQRSAFDLPDGSRVVLAADSYLHIPNGYRSGLGARDVFLDGEAYFEVKHDDRRAFRVHTATGIAEEVGNDRGTTFLVTSYPETAGFEVVVTDGAVALRIADLSAPALVSLAPGELGQLDETETATLTRNVPLAARVAWVKGTLAFEKTPLRDAVHRLARWYDLEIHVEDADLADRELTVAFPDETAEQALARVASLLDADLEWRGRVAVLRNKQLSNK